MIFHSKTKIDVNYSNKNLTSLFNSSVYFKRYLLSHNINYLDKNVLITKKVLIKNLLMQFSIDSDYFQKLSIWTLANVLQGKPHMIWAHMIWAISPKKTALILRWKILSLNNSSVLIAESTNIANWVSVWGFN
jgi:hypothetical protein